MNKIVLRDVALLQFIRWLFVGYWPSAYDNRTCTYDIQHKQALAYAIRRCREILSVRAASGADQAHPGNCAFKL